MSGARNGSMIARVLHLPPQGGGLDDKTAVGQRQADRVAPHVRCFTGGFTHKRGVGVQFHVVDEVHCRGEGLRTDDDPQSALLVEALAPEQGMPDRPVQLVVAAPVQAHVDDDALDSAPVRLREQVRKVGRDRLAARLILHLVVLHIQGSATIQEGVPIGLIRDAAAKAAEGSWRAGAHRPSSRAPSASRDHSMSRAARRTAWWSSHDHGCRR